MIRVKIYFEAHIKDGESQIELTGLSKRVNNIGLQPIPDDRFRLRDLSNDEVEKIKKIEPDLSEFLVVKKREFSFEEYSPVIRITLTV